MNSLVYVFLCFFMFLYAKDRQVCVVEDRGSVGQGNGMFLYVYVTLFHSMSMNKEILIRPAAKKLKQESL